MSFSKSRYLAVTSGHTDALVDYVLDVKPYHTKLSEIIENYEIFEDVNVKIVEDHRFLAFLGADIIDDDTPGARARRSRSWYKNVVSDGRTKSFDVPLTSVHKFLSHVSQEKYVCGVDDDYQIPGIEAGVFNQRRWDGPGITNVRKNGQHLQESFDYYLSHGVYSVEIFPSQRFKQLDTAHLSQFAELDGSLLYQDVIKAHGAIKNIVGGNYEEWTVICIDDITGECEVIGSQSGLIGNAIVGTQFNHPLISFDFEFAPEETTETFFNVGDKFVLTPFHKITVHPDAPLEKWSLIKTNPIVITSKPTFVPAQPRVQQPSLEIHTRSLDRTTQASTWAVVFDGSGNYTVQSSLPGYPRTANLLDGCSYKDENIHFTLITTPEGFYAGDVFNFTVGERVENFLVYGSESGWQPNAKLGEWYFNGKIGFKIPKLEYFAKVFNSTISISTNPSVNSWNTVVSNSQVLHSVSFASNSFYVAGEDSIVGGSYDGTSWSSEINPPAPGELVAVVGTGGTVGVTYDGETWIRENSRAGWDLNASTVIPNFLTDPERPGPFPNAPCIIVVGDRGTIITSVTGNAWSPQDSGTNKNLNDIAWSDDGIFVVGDDGLILKSLDRITWTPVSTPTTANLYGIVHEPISNAFIVVGQHGTILRSTDGGLTWLDLNQFSDGTFYDVAYGNGTYCAVGPDGYVAYSNDGMVWTRYSGKRFNSVAFGNGVFVAVGGKASEVDQFVALKPVHSMAEPSVYTITFQPPYNPGDPVEYATVVHNIHGYKHSLKVNENWEDEFCSFRLESIPGLFEYFAGDVIKIYLAPEFNFALRGWYDEHIYELPLYDTGVADVSLPLLFNEEYYPLYHSHGSVIFNRHENCVGGDEFIIDKALLDVVRFKLNGADSRFPELGSINDWIPLEFRYFDRKTNEVPSSPAHFSDLTTVIEAYLCTNSTVKVFSIDQPRFECTDRNASARLTFDNAFFSRYLPFLSSYAFKFKPDASYGQKIRVKITETLRTYARVRLIFDDISYINVEEAPIEAWDIYGSISFVDPVNITLVEGGALPLPDGYDVWPYDTTPYSNRLIYNGVLPGFIELSPGVYDYTGNATDWVIPKKVDDGPGIYAEEQSIDSAASLFFEGLKIVETEQVGSTIDRVNVFYNFSTVPPQGLLIEEAAATYVVTHNGSPGSPTLVVESLDNIGVYGSPIPSMTPYPGAPTAVSLKSFSFSLPPGFTAPFRLIIT